MYRKFYRFTLEEGDPEAVCYECDSIIEPGETVIADVEVPGYGRWGGMINKRPDTFEDVKRIWDERCFEDNYRECDDCGVYSHVDDMCWVSGESKCVCDSCIEDYYRCDRCDEYFSTDGVHTDEYDNCICDSCFDGYDYHVCDDCGRICEYGEGDWSDDDYYYCDNCIGDHRNGIYDYSYKPTPKFHRIGYHGWHSRDTSGNEPLYLGVELEVDEGCDTACVANAYDEDDIYCKHDGSLGDEGFEIVSHPRTLESHKEFNWGDVMKTCLDNGYTSHNAGTCGLHVHVSRAFFGEFREDSDFAAAKIIILVSKFWDEFMLPFSRRTNYQLERWASKPDNSEVIIPGDDDDVIHQKIDTAKYNRYKAINLTNSGTIEFRLFRGTLKYETFIATLEFVDGICNWVKNHTLEETLDISMQDFLASEEFAKFDTMRGYIKRRNIQLENGLDDEEDI